MIGRCISMRAASLLPVRRPGLLLRLLEGGLSIYWSSPCQQFDLPGGDAYRSCRARYAYAVGFQGDGASLYSRRQGPLPPLRLLGTELYVTAADARSAAHRVISAHLYDDAPAVLSFCPFQGVSASPVSLGFTRPASAPSAS